MFETWEILERAIVDNNLVQVIELVNTHGELIAYDEALYVAVYGRNLTIVRFLISKGFKVNSKTYDPLRVSIENDDIPMYKLLSAQGYVTDDDHLTIANKRSDSMFEEVNSRLPEPYLTKRDLYDF